MKIDLASDRTAVPEIRMGVAWSPAKVKSGSLAARFGEIQLNHHRSRPAEGILGLGDSERRGGHRIREAGGHCAQWLRARSIRHAVVDVAKIEAAEGPDGVVAFAEGLALGEFSFDRHRRSHVRGGTIRVSLACGKPSATLRARIRRCVLVCESANLAREWAHEPPNVINPKTLAARCRKLARASGLRCTVLDHKRLLRMKANGIVQVGAGSKTPSCLIILEHFGSGSRARSRPVALVGKAITFDTGGYSLKDRVGIVGMKFDKCGGMAVIGALQAAARTRCKVPVVGVIAAAENMISAQAYRPNDIIRMLNGKTVEIISTDAEGRMVLADALTYTERRYKPRCMIDLATLTGGVIIALGGVRAGLMSPDDALCEGLLAAGERVHERLWRLPMDEEYAELIKGTDSDLKNSAGRAAQTVVAGMFLKQFVTGATPWAHLDIAAVSDTDKDSALGPKGATGYGVRLLLDYLTHLKAR